MSSTDCTILDKKNAAILTMAAAQADAFRTAMIEAFMQWFELDIVNDYYMRRWFTGYALKTATPIKCVAEVKHRELAASESEFWEIIFYLDYTQFDPEIATFHVKLHFGESDPLVVRITDATIHLVHHNWNEQTELVASPVPITSTYNEQITQKDMRPWWATSDLTEIAYTSTDALKPSLYARALSRSSRYRSTHPEIDCAVVLSDMLSMRAIKLAFALNTDDPSEYVRRLNAYGKKITKGNTYDTIRGENRSYFPARELSLQPLHSIDGIFALSEQCAPEPAEVNCPEITSFYVTLLRLYGFSACNAFIMIQPFHYLACFQLAEQCYILSVHDIMPMTVKRLYGDTEVTRIVLPAFYLDQSGHSSMPDSIQTEVQTILKTKLPLFSIPEITEMTAPLPIEADPFISICDYATPEELSAALRHHIFTMSKHYPLSPFTWAKYAYQTLLVLHPQAYLIGSMKSPECKAFVQQQQTLSAVRTWIEQLDARSIFEEPDRIMTAEQVLHYRRGGAKDRGMLLYVAARLLKEAQSGGVIITTHGSYVLLVNKAEYTLYDCTKMLLAECITGDVILAFDEQDRYIAQIHTKECMPDWLKRVL